MDGRTVDWSLVAPEWDRFRYFVEAMKAELTPRLIAALELRPGGRVLELGAGTGELAAQLAAEVGGQGSVIASDVASGMVALAKTRLDGLPGVEVSEIDAAAIPLPDDDVDAVAFRMGLMFVPEPAQAVAEIRRVLRASGRVAAAVWAAPQDNPWLTTLGMAAMMHGVVGGKPPVGPGTPFALCDPHALRALFEGAGLTAVSITAVDGVATYSDVDAYFETAGALAPPLAAALRTAEPDAVQRVRATVAEALERFRSPDGIRMPSRAWLISATK